MLNIFTCSLIVDPMPFLLHNFASQCVTFTVCTAMNALQCRNVHTRFRKNPSTLSNFEMEHTLTTEWFFWKAWLLPLYEGTWSKNSVITSKDSNSSYTEKSIDFFRKTKPVYSENFTKYVKIVCGKKFRNLNVNVGYTQAYVYCWVLSGYLS